RDVRDICQEVPNLLGLAPDHDTGFEVHRYLSARCNPSEAPEGRLGLTPEALVQRRRRSPARRCCVPPAPPGPAPNQPRRSRRPFWPWPGRGWRPCGRPPANPAKQNGLATVRGAVPARATRVRGRTAPAVLPREPAAARSA